MVDAESAGRARYVEATRRNNVMTALGATVISVLTVIAVWGEWRLVAFVTVTQAILIGFNTFISVVYLPRRGAVEGEALRTLVNVGVAIWSGHVTHWVMPTWLWLPYVAVAFDHLGRRVAVGVLVALCVVQDTAALVDGVSWLYPLTFTLFAFFCSEMGRRGTSTIRSMLLESDAQRDAIAEAQRDLRHETKVREQAEEGLRQAHKLEAVGRLAAGVAHEINTPVQFVGDGVAFAEEGVANMLRLIVAYRAALDDASTSTLVTAARKIESEVDIDLLATEVPAALQGSREGLERVATIVRSMREFAHPDTEGRASVDLNDTVRRALLMATHEYKLIADVETDLGALPKIRCHEGEVAQVVLNIVVNAAHAIGDAVHGTDRRGVIGVRTRLEANDVLLSISDTGGGIPAEIRDRVFEPFFTTKDVGRGTGQGLAIARAVIERHGGTLSFDSSPETGTTFFIRLATVSRSTAPPPR